MNTNTITTPEERLRRVLGLAGCLYEEHRHQFIYSHVEEIANIQARLEYLLVTVNHERAQYEIWLTAIASHEQLG